MKDCLSLWYNAIAVISRGTRTGMSLQFFFFFKKWGAGTVSNKYSVIVCELSECSSLHWTTRVRLVNLLDMAKLIYFRSAGIWTSHTVRGEKRGYVIMYIRVLFDGSNYSCKCKGREQLCTWR